MPDTGMRRLGVVADDYTGAIDVAGTLHGQGYRVGLRLGPPGAHERWSGDDDVIVVALKTRSAPARVAAAQSAVAATWLLEAGVEQLFQKYSSTFDTTDDGNIGPVADALCDVLLRRTGRRVGPVLFCPAVPRYRRTVHRGHLFVGDRLMSEPGASGHPLTPRTDANLVRLLSSQTREQVGLLPRAVVTRGPQSVAAELDRLTASGVRYVVADAVDDADLGVLGTVARSHHLVTGAAGLAGALLDGTAAPSVSAHPSADLPGALVAGSCTDATLEQVRRFEERRPVLRFRPSEVLRGRDVVGEAHALACARLAGGPVGVVASAPSDVVRREHADLGRERAAVVTEDTLGAVAAAWVAAGVRRLVVAGGETSGAVLTRCGITRVTLGAGEAPGVAWVRTPGDDPLWLLLKSGPLGDEDLLVRALAPRGPAVGPAVDTAVRDDR